MAHNYQAEIREQMTEKIAKAMSINQPPWRQPYFADSNCGAPTNIASKKRYNGINIMMLQLAAMERGYRGKFWGTYQQWQAYGAQVRKRPDNIEDGCWGTKIVLWRPIEKTVKEDDDGKVKTQKYRIMKTWTVFNIDQVDGPSVAAFRVGAANPNPLSEATRYEQVEQILAATGADERWGYPPPAMYHRPRRGAEGDYITYPDRSSFLGLAQLYATRFHELAHWTEWRLGWPGFGNWNEGERYAMGELRAEITTCFMESELNIPHCDDLTNHFRYIQSWLRIMKNDPKAIFQVASDASKAVDFILSLAKRPSIHEVEPEGLLLE